ncbi:hypothetical protein BC936DRAFT_141865 [Jimgerdemannia flammicorona]|uniref:Uncharacterized protein n=1 Tax=Jimgerdemannia flammicorona TaxID=994334 RepID=A0A433A1H3_9FUNG|nr:hypothetical protein BC936DRAFT_141865 [Jimgerdemannia flammicorona]
MTNWYSASSLQTSSMSPDSNTRKVIRDLAPTLPIHAPPTISDARRKFLGANRGVVAWMAETPDELRGVRRSRTDDAPRLHPFNTGISTFHSCRRRRRTRHHNGPNGLGVTEPMLLCVGGEKGGEEPVSLFTLLRIPWRRRLDERWGGWSDKVRPEKVGTNWLNLPGAVAEPAPDRDEVDEFVGRIFVANERFEVGEGESESALFGECVRFDDCERESSSVPSSSASSDRFRRLSIRHAWEELWAINGEDLRVHRAHLHDFPADICTSRKTTVPHLPGDLEQRKFDPIFSLDSNGHVRENEEATVYMRVDRPEFTRTGVIYVFETMERLNYRPSGCAVPIDEIELLVTVVRHDRRIHEEVGVL